MVPLKYDVVGRGGVRGVMWRNGTPCGGVEKKTILPKGKKNVCPFMVCGKGVEDGPLYETEVVVLVYLSHKECPVVHAICGVGGISSGIL